MNWKKILPELEEENVNYILQEFDSCESLQELKKNVIANFDSMKKRTFNASKTWEEIYNHENLNRDVLTFIFWNMENRPETMPKIKEFLSDYLDNSKISLGYRDVDYKTNKVYNIELYFDGRKQFNPDLINPCGYNGGFIYSRSYGNYSVHT